MKLNDLFESKDSIELNEKLIQSTLEDASESYYNKSESIISDAEFDQLKEELKILNPNNPFLKKIGSKVKNTEWKKEKHSISMCSLDKVNTEKEMRDWIESTNGSYFAIQEKLDGISISLNYDNGILISAVTRGDGIVGENITKNVLKMKNVKEYLANFTGSLRGEIIIRTKDFEEVSNLMINEGEKEPSNPRNTAGGISKRLDGKYCEFLTILYYDISSDFDWNTEEFKIEFLEDVLKLDVCKSAWFSNVGSMVEYYNTYIESTRNEIDYEIDGLVLKCNRTELQEDLGYSPDGNPKGQIAWKFPPAIGKTKILDIEWSLGNSNRITPVAILEPIKISGVIIKRASLHNFEIFESFDFHSGDIVEIGRMNDVIPKILTNISKDNHENILGISYAHFCPICHELTEIDGKFLICPNENCKGKAIGNLNKWVQALNIMDISDAIINLLYENNLVKEPADFYKLTIYQIANLDRMGEKSAKKILKNFETKMIISLPEFIEGLNISQFSNSRAELLMKNGYDTLDKMMYANEEVLCQIKGIESKTANAIINGLKKKTEIIDNLLKFIMIKGPEQMKNNKLNGQSFCVTGKLETMDRDQFIEKVRMYGGQYKSSVVKDLTYLTTNDKESGSGKNKKAQAMGVVLINEQDFLKMIGE